MGADSMVVMYGLRFVLDISDFWPEDRLDAATEPFELETDPRMVSAAAAGLDVEWGKDGDGGEYSLLIGTQVATVGPEYDMTVTTADDQFAVIQRATARKLSEAGLSGTPALHIQFRGQY